MSSCKEPTDDAVKPILESAFESCGDDKPTGTPTRSMHIQLETNASMLSVETDGSTLDEFLRASCAVLEEYGENENIEALEACGTWKVGVKKSKKMRRCGGARRWMVVCAGGLEVGRDRTEGGRRKHLKIAHNWHTSEK